MAYATDASERKTAGKRTLTAGLLALLLIAPQAQAAFRLVVGAEQHLRFDGDLQRVEISDPAVLGATAQGAELELQSLAPGLARVSFVLAGDPAVRSFEVVVSAAGESADIEAVAPRTLQAPGAAADTPAPAPSPLLASDVHQSRPVDRPEPQPPARMETRLWPEPVQEGASAAPVPVAGVRPGPAVKSPAAGQGLPGAVALGIARHPEMAARRYAYERAQTEVAIARDGYLPALELSLGQDDSFSGGEAGFDILVSQMLYDWGLVGSDVDAAKARQRQKNAEILVARNDIALDVAGVYLDVLYARQRVEAVEALKRRLGELDVLVTQRALGGYSDSSERDRMTQAKAFADEQLDLRRGELARARRDYRLLVGTEAGSLPTPPYRSSEYLFDSDAALERLIERSPVYLGAVEEVLAAQAEVEGASAALKPRLVLEGSSYRRQDGGDIEEDAYFALRARMNFQGLSEFRRVSAETQGLEAARFQQASARRDLRRQVQGYLEEERALARALPAIETQLREVGSVREAYLEQFTAGYRDIEDLINIEREGFNIALQSLDTTSRLYRLTYRLSAELGVLEAFIAAAAGDPVKKRAASAL